MSAVCAGEGRCGQRVIELIRQRNDTRTRGCIYFLIPAQGAGDRRLRHPKHRSNLMRRNPSLFTHAVLLALPRGQVTQ